MKIWYNDRMIFNQNSYIKYRATLVIGCLCLLLSGFTAHAYSVVDGSSLRVFASNPDSASSSYQVRDTMKIEPDSVIVLTGNVSTPPAVGIGAPVQHPSSSKLNEINPLDEI